MHVSDNLKGTHTGKKSMMNTGECVCMQNKVLQPAPVCLFGI